MNQKQNLPPLSFAGLGDWEPYEGGGQNGFVPQEGLYEVEIMELTPELAKDGVKGLVRVDCKIVDTDVGTGTPLISRVIYFGTDQKGNNLNRQFASFINSVGTPTQNIQQWGKVGQSMPIEQAVGQLKGRHGFVQIGFEAYNGTMQSNIKNWVAKEVYTKAKENNGHRGRKADQVNVMQLVQTQGAQGTTGTTPNFGGQPNLGGQPNFAAGFGGQPTGQVANAGGNAQQNSIPNL